MGILKCDKPYNVAEARKRRGLPRTRRKNSKSTCYELAIRVPTEYQGLMGKKKNAKRVYAVNKREDLRSQTIAFEEEQSALLEDLLSRSGRLDAARGPRAITGSSPLSQHLDRYLEIRGRGAVGAATRVNEERYADYVRATIGAIPIGRLTAEDVERCLLAVPQLSREWALKRRRE